MSPRSQTSLKSAANWFAAACLGLMVLAAAFKKQRIALRALASFLIVSLISCSCAKPVAKDTIFYSDNHLGSATLLTDADGKVVGESNFDMWGNGLVSTDEPYGFIGSEYDAEAGLQYLNARYLDVRLGRFISPDLSLIAGADMGQDDPQNLNLYSYARNTPTNHLDKSGKLPHILVGALIGGGIGLGVYLAKAYFNGETASWKGALAAGAGGAVAGGLAAATGGASLILSGGISGAAGGIVERGITTGSVGEALSVKHVIGDFALGAVTAGLVKGGGALLKKVGGAVAERAGPAIKKVFDGVKSACADGACNITGDGCFVAGTLVLMAAGDYRPIEQVHTGDSVVAVNQTTGAAEAHRVVHSWSLMASSLVDVTVEGADGIREVISATSEHPFLRADGQFVAAQALHVGDELVQASGAQSRVVETRVRVDDVRVFNFEVDGLHTYAVGYGSVVVHNGPCGVNLNANGATSKFGIYEIKVLDKLYKIGKADLERVTKSSNLPTRLHQQIRKLSEVFGKENVVGDVVEKLGETTTKAAKAVETQRLQEFFNTNGFVPPGNSSSFKP
jgi:RHS repeat-associated protein